MMKKVIALVLCCLLMGTVALPACAQGLDGLLDDGSSTQQGGGLDGLLDDATQQEAASQQEEPSLVPFTLPDVFARAVHDVSYSPTHVFSFEDGFVSSAAEASEIGEACAQLLTEQWGFALKHSQTLKDTAEEFNHRWYLDHPQGEHRYYYNDLPDVSAHMVIDLVFDEAKESLEIQITFASPFLYIPPAAADEPEEEEEEGFPVELLFAIEDAKKMPAGTFTLPPMMAGAERHDIEGVIRNLENPVALQCDGLAADVNEAKKIAAECVEWLETYHDFVCLDEVTNEEDTGVTQVWLLDHPLGEKKVEIEGTPICHLFMIMNYYLMDDGPAFVFTLSFKDPLVYVHPEPIDVPSAPFGIPFTFFAPHIWTVASATENEVVLDGELDSLSAVKKVNQGCIDWLVDTYGFVLESEITVKEESRVDAYDRQCEYLHAIWSFTHPQAAFVEDGGALVVEVLFSRIDDVASNSYHLHYADPLVYRHEK